MSTVTSSSTVSVTPIPVEREIVVGLVVAIVIIVPALLIVIAASIICYKRGQKGLLVLHIHTVYAWF